MSPRPDGLDYAFPELDSLSVEYESLVQSLTAARVAHAKLADAANSYRPAVRPRSTTSTDPGACSNAPQSAARRKVQFIRDQARPPGVHRALTGRDRAAPESPRRDPEHTADPTRPTTIIVDFDLAKPFRAKKPRWQL